MKYIKFSALVIPILILLSFVGCNPDVAVPDNTTEQSYSDNTTTDPSPKDPLVLPSETNVNTYIEYGNEKINIIDAKYTVSFYPDYIEPVSIDSYIESACRSDNSFIIQFTPTDDYGCERADHYVYPTLKGAVDHVYFCGEAVDVKENDILEFHLNELTVYPPREDNESYTIGLTVTNTMSTVMRKGFSYLLVGREVDGRYYTGLSWGVYEYSTEECRKSFDEALGITRYTKFWGDVMERYPYKESKYKWE